MLRFKSEHMYRFLYVPNKYSVFLTMNLHNIALEISVILFSE